jgi:hypothetical protein
VCITAASWWLLLLLTTACCLLVGCAFKPNIKVRSPHDMCWRLKHASSTLLYYTHYYFV